MAPADCSQGELALATPDNPSQVQIEAWYMDDSPEDQRAPHKKTPNEVATPQKLAELGVLYWKLDADKYKDDYQQDPKLMAIRKARNYSFTVGYIDVRGVDKMLMACCAGYFDVRDFDDRWIRIRCCKGDLIILPEGIYHRFTLDHTDYAKAMRLFVGEPVWTPYNRPQEENPSRQKYLEAFKAKRSAAAA
ncbi:aci-reductone dioxygenase [Dunaliella salina]|uniref:acireductone dioxygenase (Fe(2+)-requiring) n=1 Tax=Dunaliella salina TaxID=3046 RepID=A0ABQ7H0X5_DUNSA|nr:aci-reductone dioxygenase [Dunaliella salina]|eukprot:KAF5840497.1 aci-reductone dioxygenase [Dunaliella salina]